MMEQATFLIPRKPLPTSSVRQLKTPGVDTQSLQQQRRPYLISRRRSFWMRRSVSFAFVLCYILLLVASELLDLYSTRHEGLASTDASAHYYWTYGPTAVLALAFAFWNRVDYRIRQMIPWLILSRIEGPAMVEKSADRSVLLDYISPAVPQILWKSLTKRHWAVFASCCISVLQTVLIVISTGLLTLSPVWKTSEMAYRTNTKFVNMTDVADSIELLSASTLPAARYDAIQTYNMTYPFGTTAHFAYQTFSSMDSSLPAQSVQQAKVDVLSIDMKCEVANLDLRPLRNGGGKVQGYTDTCSLYWERYADLSLKTCNASILLDFVAVNVDNIGNFAYYIPDSLSGGQHCDRGQVFLGVGQYQQLEPVPTNQSCKSDLTNVELTTELNIVRSRNWICKPEIKITKGTVTFSSASLQAGQPPDIKLDSNSSSQPVVGNISDYVYKMMYQSVFQDERETAINWTGIGANNGSNYPQWEIFLRALNATADQMMTTDLYLRTANQFFVEFGIQALSSIIVQKTDDIIEGSIKKLENRLQVRTGPLRAFQCILGVIIVLTCAFMTQLPAQSDVQDDLATLGGLHKLMTRNAVLTQIFQGQGSASEHQLRELCSQWQFRVCRDQMIVDPVIAKSERVQSKSVTLKTQYLGKPLRAFKVLVQRLLFRSKLLNGKTQRQANKKAGSGSWWLPFYCRKVVRYPVYLIVILIAVTLQVLLMLSKRLGGFVEVPSKGNNHPAWTFVPAGVMVAVALYFKALQSAYRIMAPYHNLRVGTGASKSINCNYLSGLEVEVLIMSLKKRQMSVFFLTIATIFSTFLTIIVSGVFTAVAAPYSDTVSLYRTSWFIKNGSNDTGTSQNNALVAGLILEANLSYPAWTYQNLAIASVNSHDIIELGSVNADRGQPTIRTTIPAIRPSLNCTLYSKQDFPDLRPYRLTPRDLLSRMPGLTECVGNKYTYLAATEWPYFSGLFDNNPRTVQNSSLQYCPLLNYYWGSQARLGSNKTATITHIQALLCHEIIEQVDVDVTFQSPQFAVDTKSPPLVHESTAKPFSSAMMMTPYEAMPLIPNPYALVSTGKINSTSPNFFAALAYRYGLKESDFGDPSKTGDIVSAIKEMHEIIRAQQYNAVLRYMEPTTSTATNGGQSDTIYSAILTDPHHYRLVQDEISTHILTAILITMVVCALLASWFMSLEYILHKSPCNIAAMLSLLADSNFTPEQSASAREWVDGLFKMGWFHRETDGKRVYTIYFDRIQQRLNSLPASQRKGSRLWSSHRHDRTKDESGTLLPTD